jgi:PAS domain S-box-containing protein
MAATGRLDSRRIELERVQAAGERRYRNLADAVPQIVWTADVAGAPTFFNQRWFDYTGAEGQRDWLVAVHPDELAACEAKWNAALVDHQPFEIICRLRSRIGTYRWHLTRVVVERDGEGQPIAWIGSLTDLDDMLRAHRQAERAIRIRDEFLSIASHELRTPLSALLVQLGGMQLTLRDGALTAPVKLERSDRKIAAALRHVGRLTKLVDDLLDIARFGTQRLTLELEEVNLAEVVREVVDRFVDVARQAGCDLAVEAPPQIVGRWDRTRVEQVMTNLLSNAVKYGRGQPIEVALQSGEDAAHLSVCDHGIGIATADQPRIFDRFERAVSAEHYGGLGLGLYIARTIVEAHGGAIHVQSSPGAGATFTVDLPIRPEAR